MTKDSNDIPKLDYYGTKKKNLRKRTEKNKKRTSRRVGTNYKGNTDLFYNKFWGFSFFLNYTITCSIGLKDSEFLHKINLFDFWEDRDLQS